MKPKLAVIWINLGPYHIARARALQTAFDLQVIELARRQHSYGWDTADTRNGLSVLTLSAQDWTELAQTKLSVLLWRHLEQTNPDVVFVPGYANLPALIAAVWSRFHRKRAILMTESTWADHPRKWWKELLKRILVQSVFDGALAGGKRSAAYAASLGFSPAEIELGYNVVDNSFYSGQTDRLRMEGAVPPLGSPHKYFLYVGRLAPEKNLHTLLGAYEDYIRRGGSWGLVLVGAGPMETELRSRAAQSVAQDQVHFAGFRSGLDLLRFYAFAGCLILPSTREPWGLVVNEAMASAVPVIVSNHCGCSDDLVEPGKNGFIFDADDMADLADKMLQVSMMPSQERASLGAHARRVVARYSLSRWADGISSMVEARA